MVDKYDIVVIGAGHAGCEAALAAARMGCQTLLLTINMDKVALMPCNPAVGGIGKGQLVREIDALGGEMGRNIDETLIQIKVLNQKKGPAVQALRAQADKKRYEDRMKAILEDQPYLTLRQGIVEEILYFGDQVVGVRASTGTCYKTRAAVVATGTFLRGMVVVGDVTFPAGRMGEFPAQGLSSSLKHLGLELRRFQTATPPRVDKRTLKFSRMTIEPGEEGSLSFSFRSPERALQQVPCYLTYTNRKTHEVVKKHLHLSPIKTGVFSGRGPRYCPSIDRKVINFPEKESHPVFVEPEGTATVEMYLQGLTTSLPVDVQIKVIQATPGLEQAKIMRPGYAVEYDYLVPDQLKASLETKRIEGLFTAGQINGTSGYEEAAAQGLIAGINAALKVKGKSPLILDRSQAYIGVLIDDLVTRGVDEPYRMFTSRAEYRLLLRSDNADLRLSPIGHQLGLISDKEYEWVEEKKKLLEQETNWLKGNSVSPSENINRWLKGMKSAPIQAATKLVDLLRRPEISVETLYDICNQKHKIPNELLVHIEAEIKYEGYIKRQVEQVQRYQQLEEKKIPSGVDYRQLKGLSAEAQEKLSRVRPHSIGQASRISGVSPADISVLMIHLERMAREGVSEISSEKFTG